MSNLSIASSRLGVTLYSKSIIIISILFIGGRTLFAQTSTDSSRQVALEQKIETMQNIIASITSLREALAEQEKAYVEAETSESKTLISEEIKQLNERLSQLKKDFNTLSTGIDQDSFFVDQEESIDLESEVKEIFSPMVNELKEMTANSREIERLRSSIPYYERRIEQMNLALANMDTINMNTQNQEVRDQLAALNEFWINHRQEHQSELETMQLQLDQLEVEQKSFGESAGDLARRFFKSRGRNLLLAIGIFILAFFSLRYVYKLINRRVKVGQDRQKRFVMRLVDLFYYLFTLIASIGLFLSVLYLASDWILLALSIILLLGLLWAGKNALPSFFEQAKLLLNLGPVREGERLVYQGIPWLVDSLNIYSELVNPELEGGSIRLPIKDLIGLRSRPFAESEPWFPTRIGDWIKLSDGYYGKVFVQTPEQVGIETQRGSYKTYPVSEFLKNKPQNLSRNFFSVNRTIGIDFKYRDRINHEIAPAVKAFFEEAVRKEPYGHLLVQIIVELKAINPSSLGLICILKFKGDTASEYFEIGWKIEQIALEALNHLDIKIPYPHLTIQREELVAD